MSRVKEELAPQDYEQAEVSPEMQFAIDRSKKALSDISAAWAQARFKFATPDLQKRVAELEAVLRGMNCPRPCNRRPDDFTVEECVAADECGCGCAALELKP